MNNHFFTPFPTSFWQFVTVIVTALLALLPLKLASSSMASVSWNR